MFYKRLLPLFIPLLIWAFIQIFYFNPKLIYVVLVLVNAVLFYAVWQLTRDSSVDNKWWNYLILPSLLLSFTILFSLFVQNKLLIQIIFVALSASLYIYLKHSFYYLLEPISYREDSLSNISASLNFVTFFLLASVIYGLQSFLNFSVLLLSFIVLVIGFLLIYQIIWANKIGFKKGLIYILIGCLIIVELAWSISFLPFNYIATGLILAICYYILVNLIKNYLLDELDSKKVRTYLLIGLIGIILVLFTSRWL